jgi:hypothetical protein
MSWFRDISQAVGGLGVLCLGLAFAPADAEAQARPYTFDQVLTMVEGGLSTEFVIGEIRTACIDFRVDQEAATQLRSAGARDDLIAALRSVCHRPASTPIRTVSPAGAAVRSLLLPGLGQFATRRPMMGVVFLGAAGGALAAGAMSRDVTQLCAGPASGECPADQIIGEESKSRIVHGIAGAAAVGVIAALEAYVAANRTGRSRLEGPRSSKGGPSLQLAAPAVAPHGAEIRLELIRLHF